ncbi:N-acetylmuramoyl-L-alanine amidase [Brevibacterium sp. BRM-1]|uniref:N-acetylmuramoyl-L-alanine amidase n=1 Tax=Brevibacterium sp. BRM-1 TaxID=2999062 RepID=UPI00228235F2|nr:N-acetylmuramoyl-L-alanine amidase [Brevibacterium sp. BRM-1]WAL41065.1 N-acetylmuramoyl-L-alanine amidase [Brevibacterium sp. BRM-1]
MAHPLLRSLALLACPLILVGCGAQSAGDGPPSPRSSTLRPEPSAASAGAASTAGASASARPTEAKDASAGIAEGALEGTTIALDPGHNGGNASHLSAINKQVPDGNGGTKACNTTGTATQDGYEEHAFTWAVGKAAKKQLEAAGATVVMSRTSDKGVGPCVDERGTFAKEKGADLLVSIHANGTESRSAKGFGVIIAPKGPEVAASKRLGKDLVAQLKDQGFPVNRAGYGSDGLNERTDLAGLMNSSVPTALVECAEMNNPSEAALMRTKAGQKRYATAIVAGIGDYVHAGG